MSQFYWNDPSTGASMSAEEFAAGTCQRPGPQPCHSSCGCAASVLNGYLLGGLQDGKWKKLLFAPTGALLSPVSSCQGETIPGICHAILWEGRL